MRVCQVEEFRRDVLTYGDAQVVVVVAANKCDKPHPSFQLARVEEV
jgi:hypothetical protein